jgi:glycosyltransferase involved in cell wall biosynthesis
MVFCEAAAFGLPVIATNTGGSGETVKEGVSGHLLSPEARGDQYAKLIKEIYSDKVRYDTLVHSARNRFEKYLNWDVWAKKLGEQLHAYKASHPDINHAKLSHA